MRTWKETEDDILNHLLQTLPKTMAQEIVKTMTNPDAHVGPALLQSFVEYVRQREVKQAYAQQSQVSKMSIDIAIGKDLDEIGKQVGVSRQYDPAVCHPEPDDAYRKRLAAAFRLLSQPIEAQDAIDAGVIFEEAKPTCECGASSLGYTQNGPGHSSWCPLASGRSE